VSLRSRVALAGGGVVLAVLVLASLVLYPSLRAKVHDQQDALLVSAVAQAPSLIIAFKTGADPAPGAPAPAPVQVPTVPVQVGSTWLQLLPDPVVVGPSAGFIAVTGRDVQVALGGRPYFHNAEYNGVRYRVYTARLPQSSVGLKVTTLKVPGALKSTESLSSSGAIVRTAVPLSVIEAPVNRLRALLVLITAAGTLLAVAAGRLTAGRVLRPVRQLTETVEHVTATQDLSARLEARGQDEIARLTRSFADMMAALEESVRSQRRLVADASHELRTPLTSITTNLELLEEGAGVEDPQAPALVRDARTQAQELKVLVNDLIDLARYGRAQTHTEDTRLDLLCERVVKRAAARAPGLVFRTEFAECLVHADPDAVERAVGNLVDNAVKWSPDGGLVEVRVGADGAVTVSDEGPGIPAQDLPHIFDRFYRSPAARAKPGSGLGLAIVRQITETHGGTVCAEPLEQGLRMRMRLPALE
jgi:two-component system, OmpR family, sensor histidine kinase MprB